MSEEAEFQNVRALILCAGKSTRMNSSLSKVLHPLGGHPILGHVIESLKRVNIEERALVISPDFEDQGAFTSLCRTYIQPVAQGTGDAVKVAEDFFKNKGPGTVLVLYGDTPLLSAQTLRKMLKTHLDQKASITVLGMKIAGPHSYGRLILNGEGYCEKIIEAHDATPEEIGIDLCNSGVMVFDQEKLGFLLERLQNNNTKKEFYLTDTVHIAKEQGWKVAVDTGSPEELEGVNTREDLAHAEEIFQASRRSDFMKKGVTFKHPGSVMVSYDTRIDEDVVIEANVIIGPGVHIGKGALIRGFSYLEGCVVGPYAQVGPFARLRPETTLGEKTRIGNFVEIKKSSIGAGSKIGHLSYVGDATVGAHVNIGAGVITCNYDGVQKHRTQIGDESFIGANVALVAPVSIGAQSLVGAGSVITKNVDVEMIAVSRSPQNVFSRKGRRTKNKTT